jgi:hypothetical protein
MLDDYYLGQWRGCVGRASAFTAAIDQFNV